MRNGEGKDEEGRGDGEGRRDGEGRGGKKRRKRRCSRVTVHIGKHVVRSAPW